MENNSQRWKNRSNLFHIEEKIGATQRAIESEKLQN
jgi:hypothetical protein